MRHSRVLGWQIAYCVLVGLQATYGDLPTPADILKIHQENQAKLDPLHVQMTFTHEFTDAYQQRRKKDAEEFDMVVKLLESKEGASEVERLKKQGISLDYMRQQAKIKRSLVGVTSHPERYEYFVKGSDYQIRSPVDMRSNAAFPVSVITADSLPREFAAMRIFSHSSRQSPTGRIWPGNSRTASRDHAVITSKHAGEVQAFRCPPGLVGLHPRWDQRHPIDTFFSAPPGRYRVVGQEEMDGHVMTIVDARVPTELMTSKAGPDGNTLTTGVIYWYRAWIDVQRGAIPMKLHFWSGSEGMDFNERWRDSPNRATVTREVARLENGAYFPIVTSDENFELDPSQPQPSVAEWGEIRAGKRALPKSVVAERETWSCMLVEAKVPGDESFFVLQLPAGQPVLDLDTEQVVGALELKPYVKPGQPAPAWKLARWLDGKPHDLQEFRGKIVVLDFWGLWCSACRNGIPSLVAVQEKFKDKPVVFVSIHAAEGDTEATAKSITDLMAENKWNCMAAIDAGTMIENSETSHAYGVQGFPTQVIIGGDGIVKFNNNEPPKGMEHIFGKICDEITAEDQKALEAFEEEYFTAAGERWPMANGLSEQEQIQISNRVAAFHLSREIEKAMATLDEDHKAAAK